MSDQSDFVCDKPLKKGEIRTLHEAGPPDACDHTNYSHQKIGGVDVLKLFKEASPNIVRLEMLGFKLEPEGLRTYTAVGTGVIVKDDHGDKHILTVRHNVHNSQNNDKLLAVTATLKDGTKFNFIHERASAWSK